MRHTEGDLHVRNTEVADAINSTPKVIATEAAFRIAEVLPWLL
jgi:hypothetical protein